MKAIVRYQYGSPSVLQLREINKPVVKDEGVLVRVRAASLNSGDLDYLYGRPLIAREDLRLRRHPVSSRGILDARIPARDRREGPKARRAHSRRGVNATAHRVEPGTFPAPLPASSRPWRRRAYDPGAERDAGDPGPRMRARCLIG
jgi:hypothetical protein